MSIATPAATSRFSLVRRQSLALAARLTPEDCQIQSMPDASPTKWHLAHTTWFFEAFVLASLDDYRVFDEDFNYLFNSYYQAIGPMHARPRRGLLSRPPLDEVLRYREHVDAAVEAALDSGRFEDATLDLIELGLQHEQQHQELLLTDILNAFSANALFPAYAATHEVVGAGQALEWVDSSGGVVEVGHAQGGFHYDNEGPSHRVFLEPFALASRLTTNLEYLAFIEDGGYRSPEYWLSPGWALVQEEGWRAPLYWLERDGAWSEFGLGGLRPLVEEAPISHLSYYEADAYARWSGARLPTEFEWEASARTRFEESRESGNLVEDQRWQAQPAGPSIDGLSQLAGDLWEWTSSSYAPYPGYCAAPGAVGEYNGKFMVNQYVLRGGSVATSRSHIRATYRNFFPAEARWQFSGVRLARSL